MDLIKEPVSKAFHRAFQGHGSSSLSRMDQRKEVDLAAGYLAVIQNSADSTLSPLINLFATKVSEIPMMVSVIKACLSPDVDGGQIYLPSRGYTADVFGLDDTHGYEERIRPPQRT
jgi:hypothetical protein